MILLATNCGFGNNDCGTLPKSALDLEAGWVDYLRPKTAVETGTVVFSLVRRYPALDVD